jgi:hypothetical protein
MAEAPLPDKLPGKLFALEWNRDRLVFILHVQDADFSSFNLGGDFPTVQGHFKRWGLKEVGYRAIDVAREFGGAKASLEDGRVVPVFPRASARKSKVKFEEPHDGPTNLPGLRAYP